MQYLQWEGLNSRAYTNLVINWICLHIRALLWAIRGGERTALSGKVPRLLGPGYIGRWERSFSRNGIVLCVIRANTSIAICKRFWCLALCPTVEGREELEPREARRV